MKKSKMNESPDSSVTLLSGNRWIDMRPLKIFITEKLPPNHPLRDIILGECDSLSAQEFIVKADVWLKLLRRDKTRD